jgi:preprotein translocase subunit SecA
MLKEIELKKSQTPDVVFQEFLKVIMLRVIDTYWTQHIDTMSELRQGVTLQSYAQQNPLVIYQQEGLRLFKEMTFNIGRDVSKYILRAHIQMSAEREAVVKNTATNQGQIATDKKIRKPKVRQNRAQRGRPF